MPRPRLDDGLTKFERYERRKKAAGMRVLRTWVWDPHDPAVQQAAREQAARIAASADEAVVMAEIEAVTAEIWDSIPE